MKAATKSNGNDLRGHFGFTTLPFTRELDIEKRWRSPLFDEPLSHLIQTVEQRQSAVLMAPSGTGKTVLLRTLCTTLPEARYRLHDVKVTSLSCRDMCREIAVAVSLEPVGTYPTLMRRLQQHFRTQSQDDGMRPVLMIDEAQDMRLEVLATLRLLTNFDLDSRLLLSVLLVGDSRLRPMLERHELEPVRRRMAHCASLRLLTRAETCEYIGHRLTIAGSTQTPFEELALDAVYEITRGNLRAVDHLCLKTLELAARKGLDTIGPMLVAEARQLLLL